MFEVFSLFYNYVFQINLPATQQKYGNFCKPTDDVTVLAVKLVVAAFGRGRHDNSNFLPS